LTTAATGFTRDAAMILPYFVAPAQPWDAVDRVAASITLATATVPGPARPESGPSPSARSPLDTDLVDAFFRLSSQRL